MTGTNLLGLLVRLIYFVWSEPRAEAQHYHVTVLLDLLFFRMQGNNDLSKNQSLPCSPGCQTGEAFPDFAKKKSL